MGGMPVQRAGAGSRPAASVFLLLRQKKGTKEKATLHAASLRFAAGNLRCSCLGCAAELTSRLRRSVQTTAASQFTMRVCPAAHAPPHALRSSAHPEGRGAEHPHGPSLRSAQPARRAAPAPANGGRAQRWPVRLFGCSAVHPCWLRLRRGGCGVSMRASARMLRELTRRSCLNGAATQRSEFCGAPRKRPAAGLPRSAAQGSQTGGSPFLW